MIKCGSLEMGVCTQCGGSCHEFKCRNGGGPDSSVRVMGSEQLATETPIRFCGKIARRNPSVVQKDMVVMQLGGR